MKKRYDVAINSTDLEEMYPCPGCKFFKLCEQNQIACLNFYTYVSGRAYKNIDSEGSIRNKYSKFPGLPNEELFAYV